jgi:hypothetical protein
VIASAPDSGAQMLAYWSARPLPQTDVRACVVRAVQRLIVVVHLAGLFATDVQPLMIYRS